MDITALITGGVGLVGIGSTILYFRPKLKRMQADTEGVNLKNLESVLDSLTMAYEQRLKIVEGNYTMEINGIRRQHELLQTEVNELRAKISSDGIVYALDRETLAKVRKAIKEGERCPNWETCPMKLMFHQLGGKL